MDNINVAFSINKQKLGNLRAALAVLLSETVCKIKFEKVDGTDSEMKCTLKSDVLPPIKGEKQPNMEVLPVWKLDGDKSGWRSFRIDSLKSVEVLYE